jgi:hypothetical protein
MADTAEYFLAELGPVPPVEVVPLLRVVAADLAVRHESPEALVEEFRNGWGGVEVMGGTPADRLLAAELITGSGVPQGEIYSAMMTTVERLGDVGCASPVGTAAILHLFPVATNSAPLDRWKEVRTRVPYDEGAALIAGFPDLPATLRRWEGNVSALGGSGTDVQLAAVYLAAAGTDDPSLAPRAAAVARLLADSFALPRLAGAVAVSLLPLSAEEVSDWLDKSVAWATARQLAPNPAQLKVLGLALLQGLDPVGFQGLPPSAWASNPAPGAGLLARTALHAWLFRDVLRRAAPAR